VFFWQSGQDASLLAVGHVTSPVFERDSPFGPYAVGIVLDYKVVPPLTRHEVTENTILRNFRPFTGAQGTNFVIHDPSIVAELDTVLKARLLAISSKPAPDDSQRDLDAAIKRVRQQVANQLQKHISQMDPAAFEWLVRALLLKLGYTNVEVTKQSGDGGVDVRATLVAGGVASLRTCIQAKRQQSVGRPIVQNLRGSLSTHEAGLLVTSGGFTQGAVEEAKEPTKVPIALIDGRKLTELLLDHEIGVRHERVTLYRLELADLSPDQLETVGETDL
jgi:restriction endonuclease Mrr